MTHPRICRAEGWGIVDKDGRVWTFRGCDATPAQAWQYWMVVQGGYSNVAAYKKAGYHARRFRLRPLPTP